MAEFSQSQCDELVKKIVEVTAQISIQARKTPPPTFYRPILTIAQAKAAALDDETEVESLVKQNQKIQDIQTSPLLKLPYDVVYEIFLTCLAHQPQLTQNCTLLVLSHISQQTRRIVLESARLWSSIAIYLSPSNIDICEARVKEWLRRSGELPLSLYVKESPSCVPVGEKAAALFNMILDESYRWENVTFSALWGTMKHLLPDRSVQTPLLRSVDIEAAMWDDSSSEIYRKIYNNSSFANNPALERLRIALPLGYNYNFHIQWSSLTSLSLGSPFGHWGLSLEAATKILNQGSQLRKLDITIFDIFHMEGSLVLPLLNDLTLRTTFWSCVCGGQEEQVMFDWLAGMNLPSLKRLALSEYVIERLQLGVGPLLFQHLLQNVGDHLVHLSLTRISSPAFVIAYLRLCPNLETLYIEDLLDFRFKGVNDVAKAWYDYLRSKFTRGYAVRWGEALLHCFVRCPNCQDLVEMCPRLKTFYYVGSDGNVNTEYSISEERKKMAEMGGRSLGV